MTLYLLKTIVYNCADLARSPNVNVMWAELGHCHFLYVPAVLNVTTGNGTGTKNVLKRTMRLSFSSVSSLLSSQCYYCSESKPTLYLDAVYCKFLHYVSVDLAVNKYQQFSTQTSFLYLGLVSINTITGTCCS